jgi:tetratricopeptide (TPR) repeat protein
MIRHQVYFDTLGSMQEDSASWRSVFAGLSVLRLVDTYADAGSPAHAPGWEQLHAVRAAIEAVSEGDTIRGVLTTVLEEATKRGAIDDTVCASLLAYGRSLDYEASWGLATDVFATVAKLVRPEKNARLAVEANVLIGGAARRNGDWDTSARAYSQAAYIADTLGDKPGVLTVQVGIANTYLAKGNMPQAETILDDVIVQARDQNLPEIQGKALHSRAAVAHRRGQHVEGLKLAHEALHLIQKPADRDVVLEDIAGFFSELGLRDSARDTHMILSTAGQTKLLRWTATANLMELASLDGMEDAFDAYAKELEDAPMGCWVRSHYLLFLGEGMARFGRTDAAEAALQEAVAFAEANQVHQIVFQAQTALSAVRSTPRPAGPFVAPAPWNLEEIAPVIATISNMRRAAVAAQ